MRFGFSLFLVSCQAKLNANETSFHSSFPLGWKSPSTSSASSISLSSHLYVIIPLKYCYIPPTPVQNKIKRGWGRFEPFNNIPPRDINLILKTTNTPAPYMQPHSSGQSILSHKRPDSFRSLFPSTHQVELMSRRYNARPCSLHQSFCAVQCIHRRLGSLHHRR